jgi:Arc/MetJ-type ribon-helix-helix transcriptional regulator
MRLLNPVYRPFEGCICGGKLECVPISQPLGPKDMMTACQSTIDTDQPNASIAMTYHVSKEVARVIQAKMASGKYASTDELLLDALQSLEKDDEELLAIQEGVASLERGEEGVPLHEAFEAVRKRHNIQS